MGLCPASRLPTYHQARRLRSISGRRPIATLLSDDTIAYVEIYTSFTLPPLGGPTTHELIHRPRGSVRADSWLPSRNTRGAKRDTASLMYTSSTPHPNLTEKVANFESTNADRRVVLGESSRVASRVAVCRFEVKPIRSLSVGRGSSSDPRQ